MSPLQGWAKDKSLQVLIVVNQADGFSKRVLTTWNKLKARKHTQMTPGTGSDSAQIKPETGSDSAQR